MQCDQSLWLETLDFRNTFKHSGHLWTKKRTGEFRGRLTTSSRIRRPVTNARQCALIYVPTTASQFTAFHISYSLRTVSLHTSVSRSRVPLRQHHMLAILYRILFNMGVRLTEPNPKWSCRKSKCPYTIDYQSISLLVIFETVPEVRHLWTQLPWKKTIWPIAATRKIH